MSRTIKNYIDGQWVGSGASALLPVHDPATCEHLADCPDSTAADVDLAVTGCQGGFR